MTRQNQTQQNDKEDSTSKREFWIRRSLSDELEEEQLQDTSSYDAQIRVRTRIEQKTFGYLQMGENPGTIDANGCFS